MSQTFEFKAEIQQLLNILVHSLYTEREIFLRELLSNASDALHRLQFEMLTNQDVLDAEAPLEISITIDKDAGTLTVADTGIGMTRDELITNLGTIAQSGATTFLQALQEKGDMATNIIGQFGVGFYSVFMAADEVQVTSRSFQADAAPARWISDGSDQFRIEDAEKETRGTEMRIKLKDDATEFLDEWRVRQIIKRHSDFVAFPIYLNTVSAEDEDADKDAEETAPDVVEERKAINQQVAIWRKSPGNIEDEDYTSFYKQITLDFEEPLLQTHLSSEAPLDLHAILFVPSKRERGMFGPKEPGLKMYAKKIMIQERTTDLLPDYLRFVEGVVDSEDFPLNVSRESVQANPITQKVKNNLVRRVTTDLDRLSRDEPDKYLAFWREFGIFIKEGVATAPEDHKRLTKLLRFHSSRTGAGEWLSLKDYVERMPDDQEAIFYLFGEDLNSITHSPHLDPFKATDTEVLYLTDPVDSFVMVSLREFDGHELKNIADADTAPPAREKDSEDADTETPETLPDDLFNPLLKRFNEVLTDKVVAVRESSHLRESPARLVQPDNTPGDSMDRVRKLVDQDFTVTKRIMEINRQHPLVRDMALALNKNAMDNLIPEMAEQLYENALLLEGIHPNPSDMVGRIQDIMAAAAKARSEE